MGLGKLTETKYTNKNTREMELTENERGSKQETARERAECGQNKTAG